MSANRGVYSEGRFWFKRKGMVITIGLTEKTAEELGEVRQVELPDNGDDFAAGDVVVEITGQNDTVELITPASGLIQEINDTMKEEPALLLEDPTEEGWLVKLEMQDASDLEAFIDEDESSDEE